MLCGEEKILVFNDVEKQNSAVLFVTVPLVDALQTGGEHSAKKKSERFFLF